MDCKSSSRFCALKTLERTAVGISKLNKTQPMTEPTTKTFWQCLFRCKQAPVEVEHAVGIEVQNHPSVLEHRSASQATQTE